MKYFYLSSDNEQIGPVSQDELIKKINPTTLVWREGMTDWVKANVLIELAQTCQIMHGYESKPRVGDGKRALTLECVSDPFSIQDSIIKDVYLHLYEYINKKFGIKLNPYIVLHDMHRELNLMESVIYPIKNSGLYTVHGVQYTTADWIKQKVFEDVDVARVLYTTLSRRNIVMEAGSDYRSTVDE